MILALLFSPRFGVFLFYPLIAVFPGVTAFRDECQKHLGKTSRQTSMVIILEGTSIWSAGAATVYLFFYAAILVYPGLLFGGILLSAFCMVDTFFELGRFLARVAMRRRMQDASISD